MSLFDTALLLRVYPKEVVKWAQKCICKDNHDILSYNSRALFFPIVGMVESNPVHPTQWPVGCHAALGPKYTLTNS